MKYFIDTEFIEDGRTIDLISLGIVAEDGRAYYAVSNEFDPEKASVWVVENVLARIPAGQSRTTRDQIAVDIVQFVGEKPEFWGYFADYDWVVLCQLYGRMIDLPDGWPMYCRDLKQMMDQCCMKRTDIPIPQSAEHHALADAIWIRDAYYWLLRPRRRNCGF